MESKNVKTLRNAHQAFSAKKLDQAQEFVATQVRFTGHGRGQVLNGRAEFRGWMESHFAMSSDMRIIEARYIDAGDYVTAQFRAVGVQDGPLMAFPPSGKPFCDRLRCEGNRPTLSRRRDPLVDAQRGGQGHPAATLHRHRQEHRGGAGLIG